MRIIKYQFFIILFIQRKILKFLRIEWKMLNGKNSCIIQNSTIDPSTPNILVIFSDLVILCIGRYSTTRIDFYPCWRPYQQDKEKTFSTNQNNYERPGRRKQNESKNLSLERGTRLFDLWNFFKILIVFHGVVRSVESITWTSVMFVTYII